LAFKRDKAKQVAAMASAQKRRPAAPRSTTYPQHTSASSYQPSYPQPYIPQSTWAQSPSYPTTASAPNYPTAHRPTYSPGHYDYGGSSNSRLPSPGYPTAPTAPSYPVANPQPQSYSAPSVAIPSFQR
jgi:hypothetical protein